MIAGKVYEHKTIESLRREPWRDPFLRQVCGFDVLKGQGSVPTVGAYSRFVTNLMDHQDELKKIFKELLSIRAAELEGFGKSLAIDGKALPSFARRTGTVEDDRRGEHDANWGKHVVRTEGADGKVYEKTKTASLGLPSISWWTHAMNYRWPIKNWTGWRVKTLNIWKNASI